MANRCPTSPCVNNFLPYSILVSDLNIAPVSMPALVAINASSQSVLL